MHFFSDLAGAGHGRLAVEADSANFGVFPVPTSKAPFPVTGAVRWFIPGTGQWRERYGTPDDHRVCRGGPPCGGQARYVGSPCTRRHDPDSQR